VDGPAVKELSKMRRTEPSPPLSSRISFMAFAALSVDLICSSLPPGIAASAALASSVLPRFWGLYTPLSDSFSSASFPEPLRFVLDLREPEPPLLTLLVLLGS